MKKIFFVFFFFVAFNFSFAQLGFEVNQQMLFQPMVNPASSASYSTPSFCGYYRNQWVGFDGAPESFGFAGVIPVESAKGSVGLTVFRDKVGARTRDELTAYYAYRMKVNQKFFLSLSLGGKLNFLSRGVTDLEITQEGDALVSDYQNKIGVNSVFGSYLFSRNFYVGLVVPRLLQNDFDAPTGTLNTSFSFNRIPLILHLGKEISLKNLNHHLNLSTLVKSSYGAGVHSEFNFMYQVLDRKIGLGFSYRTSKELVAILKLSPIKQFVVSYGYQLSVSGISSYQSGSHEVLLVYNIDREKKVAKLYAPRF